MSFYLYPAHYTRSVVQCRDQSQEPVAEEPALPDGAPRAARGGGRAVQPRPRGLKAPKFQTLIVKKDITVLSIKDQFRYIQLGWKKQTFILWSQTPPIYPNSLHNIVTLVAKTPDNRKNKYENNPKIGVNWCKPPKNCVVYESASPWHEVLGHRKRRNIPAGKAIDIEYTLKSVHFYQILDDYHGHYNQIAIFRSTLRALPAGETRLCAALRDARAGGRV